MLQLYQKQFHRAVVSPQKAQQRKTSTTEIKKSGLTFFKPLFKKKANYSVWCHNHISVYDCHWHQYSQNANLQYFRFISFRVILMVSYLWGWFWCAIIIISFRKSSCSIIGLAIVADNYYFTNRMNSCNDWMKLSWWIHILALSQSICNAISNTLHQYFKMLCQSSQWMLSYLCNCGLYGW